MKATVNVNFLAIQAQRGLSLGSDDQFSQLIKVLNSHRDAYINDVCRRYPSVDRADIDSEYMVTLWKLVLSYNLEKGDFLRMFNAALRFKAIDILRKALPNAKYTQSLDAFDEESGMQHVLPTSSSAEDEYFERIAEHEAVSEMVSGTSIDPFEQAVIWHKVEHDTSLDKVVSIFDDRYRNKQQLHRKTIAKIRKVASVGGFAC